MPGNSEAIFTYLSQWSRDFFSWCNRKTLLNIPDLENIYTFHHWKYYRKKKILSSISPEMIDKLIQANSPTENT